MVLKYSPFYEKIVPSNDMNSIYVMRKRGELKEYKLQFLSIKKGLHYLLGRSAALRKKL